MSAVLQFTIKAKDEASRVVKTVTAGVQSDIKALDSTVGRLAQSFGLSESKSAALAKSLPYVGAAAGAVAGVVTAAGAAIFTLTKNASDAGSAIFEAGQKTNASAEFLSVLKVQAEQSGSSFEGATAKVVKWGNSLVDAARGNPQLIADLKRFDIEATTAYRNPEAALKKFIESFNRLPPSAANNEAAMRLFKDRSGELIPVLRAFGDDYEGLVRKLDASGQIWTQEGVEKADEFGDALTELGQTAAGIGNVFAREVMPEITSAMKDITKTVVDNRASFREWGRDVGDIIRGVRVLADSHLGTLVSWLSKAVYYTTPLAMLVGQTAAIGKEAGDAEAIKNFGPLGARGVATPLKAGTHGTSTTAPDDVTNEAAAKKAASAREALRKAELRAAEKDAEERLGIERRFVEKVEKLNEGVRREIEEARKESKRRDEEDAERRADAYDAVREALRQEIAILTDENTHLTAINATIRRAEILGAIDARTAAFARQLAVVNELAKVPLPSPVGADAEMPQGRGQKDGPWVDPTTMEPPPAAPWTTFGEVVSDVSNRIGEAVGVSGATVTGVMGNMAAAISQTVQAFGGLGGAFKNLGEFFKAVVKNIRDMAAINAIWELAQAAAAFALSFFWPGMMLKAKAHLKAAALYGVVALGAGAMSAAMGSAGGGASGGGTAFGGSQGAGASGSSGNNSYEDYRTRYTREQDERDRHTRREDRREETRVEVPVYLDGRELARGVVRIVRDGGDVRRDFKDALGVTA